MSRALLLCLALVGCWDPPEPGALDLIITSDAPEFVRDADVAVTVIAPGRSLTRVDIAGEAATLAAGTGTWTATLSPAELRRLVGTVPDACGGEDLSSPGGNTARVGIEVVATPWPGDSDAVPVPGCLVVAVDTTPDNLYDGISLVLQEPSPQSTLPRLLPNKTGLQPLELVLSTTDPSSIKDVAVKVTGGSPAEFTARLSQQPVTRAIDVVAGQPLLFATVDETVASTLPYSLVAGPEAPVADMGVELGKRTDVVFTAPGVIEACRFIEDEPGLTLSSADLNLAHMDAWKPRTDLAITQLHRVTVQAYADATATPAATSSSSVTIECRDQWDRRARSTVTAGPSLPDSAGLALVVSDELVAPDEEITLELTAGSAAEGLAVAWGASVAGAPTPIGPAELTLDGAEATAGARFLIPSDASGVITLSATVSSRRVDAFVQVSPDLELFPRAASLRPGQSVVIRSIDGLPDYTCTASVVGGEALSDDTAAFIREGTSLPPSSTGLEVTIAANDPVDAAGSVILRCSDDAGRTDTATVTLEASPKEPEPSGL